MKLHVGCGGQIWAGWLNCDILPGDGVDLVFDAGVTWPLKTGSATVIAAYHILEHLHRHQGRTFLAEAHRVLAPGGTLLLEVPDLEEICRRIGAGDYGPLEPHGEPLHLLNLYGAQRPGGRFEHDFHRWGYTRRTLTTAVERAGLLVRHTGTGTDYHATELGEPCLRLEAWRC